MRPTVPESCQHPYGNVQQIRMWNGDNKGMSDDQAQERPDGKPEEQKKTVPRPVPVRQKIGEPPGNLRKREEWFRKRSRS